MQPLMIDLTGKKVVIVGGGQIAARKAKVLAEEKAEITFIAPSFSKEVKELAEKKGYLLIKREAVPSDFTDAILVILATNDRKVNHELSLSILPHKLVCVVDRWEEGNVLFPGTVRRGKLQIAVSSGGASPKLTRKLKRELEAMFDESWTRYIEFLSECRRGMKTLPISPEEKNHWLNELLNDKYRTNDHLQKEEIEKIKQKKEYKYDERLHER